MSVRDEQPATVPPPAGEDDAYSATTKVGAMPAELMAKLRAEGLLPEEGSVPPAPGAAPASTETSARTAPPPPRPSPSAPPRPAPRPLGAKAAVARAVPVVHSSAPPANQDARLTPLAPEPTTTAPPPPTAPSEPAEDASSSAPPGGSVELLAPFEPSGVPRIRLDTPSADLAENTPSGFPGLAGAPDPDAPSPVASTAPTSTEEPPAAQVGVAALVEDDPNAGLGIAVGVSEERALPARSSGRRVAMLLVVLLVASGALIVALLSQRG